MAVGVFLLRASFVGAQDFTYEEREAAKTWAMHQIAVIQAEQGDIQGAKNTASQIKDHDSDPGPSVVTVVSFFNGEPIYERPPMPAEHTPAGWGECDDLGNQYFLTSDQPAACVPAEAPAGLPSNYLASDPRHGEVVEFTDEHDANGTRVTSRRYADGYSVIETPH